MATIIPVKHGEGAPSTNDDYIIIVIVPARREKEDLPRCRKIVKPDRKAEELARRKSELSTLFSFANDSDDDSDGAYELLKSNEIAK